MFLLRCEIQCRKTQSEYSFVPGMRVLVFDFGVCETSGTDVVLRDLREVFNSAAEEDG